MFKIKDYRTTNKGYFFLNFFPCCFTYDVFVSQVVSWPFRFASTNGVFGNCPLLAPTIPRRWVVIEVNGASFETCCREVAIWCVSSKFRILETHAPCLLWVLWITKKKMYDFLFILICTFDPVVYSVLFPSVAWSIKRNGPVCLICMRMGLSVECVYMKLNFSKHCPSY
jgi:hypothetical protein